MATDEEPNSQHNLKKTLRPVFFLLISCIFLMANFFFIFSGKNFNVVEAASGSLNIGGTSGNVNIIAAPTFQGTAARSGTGTLSSSGTTVTGNGTSFTTQLSEGDRIVSSSQTRVVTAIASNTSLTTNTAFSPTLSGASFTYQKPIFRVVDANSNVKMLIDPDGNVGVGTLAPSTNFDIGASGSLTEGGTPLSSKYAYVGGGNATGTWGISISGNAATATSATNISAYTINQNLGTSNSPTFGGLTLTGNLTPNTTNFNIAQSATNGNVFIKSNGTGDVYINNDAGDDISIGNNSGSNVAIGATNPGSAKLYVNGNVGIGTTSPSALLDVNGGDLSVSGQIYDAGGSELGIGSNDNINIDSGQLYVLNSSGNVGIGTTTPRNGLELDTRDSNYITSIRIGNKTQGTTGGGTGSEMTRNQVLFSSWRDIYTDSVGAKIAALNLDYSGNSLAQKTDLAFYTNAFPSSTDSTTERMRITNGGNVGIGTTNPGTKLEVSGDITESGYLSVTGGQDANGNIRFSTANPYIKASSYIVMPGGLYVSGGTGYFTNQTQMRGGVHNDSAAYLTLAGGTSGYTYVSGSLGVGNSGPSYPLDVTGNVRSTGTIYANANGQAYFCGGDDTCLYDVNVAATLGIQGNGGNSGIGAIKLGSAGQTIYGNATGIAIGTTSPAERFHVYGGQALFQVASTNPVIIDRLTDDGTLIQFKQAGTAEGNVSVSGTTVSYNAFTGSHYALIDNRPDEGTLISLIGINSSYDRKKGAEPIYGVKITQKANDDKILGSYLGLLESNKPQSESNPSLIMAVGNGDMWVVDTGKNIEAGDYLISSDTPGHAMKEDGSFDEAYVVARSTENINWADVKETINGKKHKKISVTYENFVKQNNVNKKLEDQQKQIDDLSKKVELLIQKQP